jgi:hypothetical protein
VKLLLDINVLLDVLLDREPWSEAASQLLSAVESTETQGFVAPHTLPTIYYVMAQSRNRSVAAAAVTDLLRILDVAPLTKADYQEALALPITNAPEISCGPSERRATDFVLPFPDDHTLDQHASRQLHLLVRRRIALLQRRTAVEAIKSRNPPFGVGSGSELPLLTSPVRSSAPTEASSARVPLLAPEGARGWGIVLQAETGLRPPGAGYQGGGVSRAPHRDLSRRSRTDQQPSRGRKR